MEYCFFIKQVPVIMSPLFDNSSILRYEESPLNRFFSRGLKVSLATRDPLRLHATSQALMEEYAIASQVPSLSLLSCFKSNQIKERSTALLQQLPSRQSGFSELS